eukprot:4583706-Alexandrium_andersonii.AAC.1
MSASLVGSEMCIRDRITVPWNAVDHLPQSRARTGLFHVREDIWERFQPVSYTHLNAADDM